MPLPDEKNVPLSFRPDGTFRVMQFSDIQDVAPVSADTLILMGAALDAERPDLVVLTGDQVKGYAPAFRGKRPQTADALARLTIAQMCAPMIVRGIPFAVTYGNHDRECGVPNAAQDEFYRALPGCLNAHAWAELRPGTLCLPVAASNTNESQFKMAVWLADSGAGDAGGGYEPFPAATTEWLVSTADRLAARAGGPVGGILFQHIPLPQAYDCLRPAHPGEGGVAGHRTHYAPHLTLVCDEAAWESGGLREPVCCPDADTGEFDALVRQGCFFGVFYGHDHKNTLVARHRGIRMGYAPTVGFGTYGPGTRRAARLFVFAEDDPSAFETSLLDYHTLVGERAPRPLRDWLSSQVPVTAEEARELFRIPALMAAATAIAAVACRVVHAFAKRYR